MLSINVDLPQLYLIVTGLLAFLMGVSFTIIIVLFQSWLMEKSDREYQEMSRAYRERLERITRT